MRHNLITKISLRFILLVFLVSCKKGNYQKIDKEITIFGQKTFVGSRECAECHADEYDDWNGSHHDLSMQKATFKSVLGDFNNVTFESKGITFKFFKKDDGFYVNTEGVDGKYDDYKVSYTFGVYPLQQYLIQFPDGKYQCLLTAWNSEKKIWFDLQPNLDIHHSEWIHWTGGSMTWNNMCADCHSTNLKKNFEPKTKKYNTTYDIINVSCEACHGPGSNHTTYYNNIESYSNQDQPELYMKKNMDSKEVVQKCARCHSRRTQLTSYFNYEGDFLDHYSPFLITDPTYHLDGQINDEAYVYGSFAQSAMYQNGVSCNDCHNPHTLSLKKEGNALCLNCHAPSYNEYSHHFHQTGTKESQCINCHMTGKMYMGNDFRRDHSFRVPRPDQTVLYNTPNACNNCHKDKSSKWASEIIKENYGEQRKIHFSDELLAGYQGDLNSFHKVFSNLKHPEIIRASALNRYGNSTLTQERLGEVLKYVKDISPLVRNEAIVVLSKNYHHDSISNFIEPLLLDSLRLVRISAVSYFKSFDKEILFKDNNIKSKDEYYNELSVNSDFASVQHKIALEHQKEGDNDKAIEAYYSALDIDNYYNMSRINLASIEYNRGNIDIAKNLYIKVIEQEPEFSHSFYMLGLLYNELGDTNKSLEYLKLSCNKDPKMVKAFYNYSLKLQESNLLETSLKTINEGLNYFPNNEKLLYVKLIGLLKSKKNQEAQTIVSELLKINPENSNYLKIFKRLNKNNKTESVN